MSVISRMNLNDSFCAFLLVTATIAEGVKTLISATGGKVVLRHPPSSWCAVLLASIEKHVTVHGKNLQKMMF